MGLQPIGMLVGGALIDATSGATTIAAMGSAIVLISLAFLPVGRAPSRVSLAPR